MDLYEYQARELLNEKNIPIPHAIMAFDEDTALEAAQKVGYPCVIKAQVRTGHRGQAGGVKIAHNSEEVRELSRHILGMTIHGHDVYGVLIAEAVSIIHEYYVSISVDRNSRDYDVLATAAGGTEVEEIARAHPEYVKRLHIGPLDDFDLDAARDMARQIGFYHADEDQAATILLNMWKVFQDNDATLVEINPLAKIGNPDDDASKKLCALDAKISLDSNAAFRHDNWLRFADSLSTDPWEVRARENGLHYVRLDGNVGIIGNGAGLVMSSLDAVADAGKAYTPAITPANFLDIGGGASAHVMAESLDIVMSDPRVQSVVVNVYGGLTSCKLVAQGILEALDALSTQGTEFKPIIVRFDGNESREGLDVLKAHSNYDIRVTSTMEEAAQYSVQAAYERMKAVHSEG